jgi:DNA-binding Lrp family transcriptional regulator
LDELDLRLFNAIERNPRASFKDLSSLLGITATSVQKRVIELEDSGRILRIVAQLHPDSFGASIGIVHGQTKGVLTKRMVRALQDQGSLRDLGFGAGNQ